MISIAADGPALIEFRAVDKTYMTEDGPVHALRDVNLRVHDGEFLSMVGPSGCGKSTALKMVAGLLPVSDGEIRIDGQPIVGPPDRVGMVFQSPVLLAWRNVLENVLLQIQMRRLAVRDYEARARELIKMVGLDGFERKRPWELSGGMQQRVSICRALVHDPDLLLMDEPFGALDAMTRETMAVELQRIWRAARKTVLFVTHSIPEAVFLSDRVLVMTERPGRIAAIYPVELPRPRSFDDMRKPAFIDLVHTVRGHFQAAAEL